MCEAELASVTSRLPSQSRPACHAQSALPAQVSEGVILEGSPETQHSWFPGVQLLDPLPWNCALLAVSQRGAPTSTEIQLAPKSQTPAGYAWQCAYCSCQQHIGWRFTAVRPCLRPASFWGLRRPALQAGGNREGMGPGGGMFLHQGSSDEDGDGGWTSGEEEESLEGDGSQGQQQGSEEGSPLSSGSPLESGDEGEGGAGASRG